MAKLTDRIQNVLDEARMLVLGSQVLLGFQYRSFFEPGFITLGRSLRYVGIASLACLLLALAMLMSPGAHHQLLEGGRDTERLHDYASIIIGIALLPFAMGLAAAILLVTYTIIGIRGAAIAGLAAALIALVVLVWTRIHQAKASPHPQAAK
ncbi:MAG TPA: DUF6328 family protein [Blastocatellia bacterium]|nr:DUF6328 family protein [Blastocatellia bacterium]